jgi:RNA-splicing ligase RtcB
MIEIQGKYTTATIMLDEVEEATLAQIYNMANHPAFTNPIVIQVDTHVGKGSVIGFTMKLTDKVVPSVIGVDIGCSIQAVNVSEFDIALDELDKRIRKEVAFGMRVQQKSFNFERNFDWKTLNEQALVFHNAYEQYFNIKALFVPYDYAWLQNALKKIQIDGTRFSKSVGTLGGGNHFIEIGQSETSGKWLIVHTGSRNFGKRICDFWQQKAKDSFKKKIDRSSEIERIKATLPTHQIEAAIKYLPSSPKFSDDAFWLEGADAYGYFRDMFFAQKYANLNRSSIVKTVVDILGAEIVESVTSVHNYIDFSDFMIRKGAIRAYKDEKMVIPFNMRDGVLLCTGKSNPDFNFSGPHGAGRILSRSKAKEQLSMDAFVETMKGIYSTSVNRSTLDESPDAYKNCKLIEESITNTVDIVDRLIPILNLKDSSSE